MTNHLSKDIFSIASEFGIPFVFGQREPMSDDDFVKFRDRYLTWSKKRDEALRHYLTHYPQLFRVLLPYTTRVFTLASQVVWYIDELIIRDPIIKLLDNNKESAIEENKDQLQQIIQVLAQFKNAIEGGYILLYGQPFVGATSTTAADLASKLISISEIRQALDEAAYCGFTRANDSFGNPVGIYQISLDTAGIFGFDIKSIKVGPGQSYATPAINVYNRLPRVTKQQLQSLVSNDPFKQMDSTYIHEIEATLVVLEAAQRANAAVMFDRIVDSIVIDHTHLPIDPNKQNANVQVLNVVAPYLKNIPSDRLQDIRDKMPNAFKDFRARLYEIVSAGMKNGVGSAADLHMQIDREIVPSLRSLESELNAETKRSRILGYGAPALAAIGSLIGTIVNHPVPEYITLGSTAVSLAAAADTARTKEKLKGSPFYFLWKANQ